MDSENDESAELANTTNDGDGSEEEEEEDTSANERQQETVKPLLRKAKMQQFSELVSKHPPRRFTRTSIANTLEGRIGLENFFGSIEHNFPPKASKIFSIPNPMFIIQHGC